MNKTIAMITVIPIHMYADICTLVSKEIYRPTYFVQSGQDTPNFLMH